MKKIINIATLLTLSMSASTLFAEENDAKKYLIESGKISYEIKGSGNVMGMLKTDVLGKKKVVFNNFGLNELTEESKIEKITQNGKTENKKTHTLQYAKGSINYSVEFDKKRIMRSKNPAMGAMMQLFSDGQNMTTMGQAMLEKMGGKKTGTDEVAGKKCDIWTLMGTTQCLYNGIPLRVVSDVMGIKMTEVATKAEFGIDVTKVNFKLPDYPVFDMNMERLMEGKQPEELDKSSLDELDKQADIKAAQDVQGIKEMKSRMTEAAKQAGVKEGESPTTAQGEAMMQNMQSAMFPKIKKNALQQVELMEFGKECLGAADTLKAANKCAKEANEKYPSGDDMEVFEEWNPQIKQELLNDINSFGSSLDCIKASTDMTALQKCMPSEND